jgi:hypothetical protein
MKHPKYMNCEKQSEVARRAREEEARKHKKTSEQIAQDVADWERTNQIDRRTVTGEKI